MRNRFFCFLKMDCSFSGSEDNNLPLCSIPQLQFLLTFKSNTKPLMGGGTKRYPILLIKKKK